jgi:crotonobetainyl-CoA:carnitine CoA-transferase CaiB-like acyl-CoA transferase
MGADVIVVEPAGGDETRSWLPRFGTAHGDVGSLWWEHYATSKRSVVADLGTDEGVELVARLIRAADIVLDGAPPGRLEAIGLGPREWCDILPALIWTSVTSFGHCDPRSSEPFSDLTILAEGGPVWSCGYDDHRLPPVRGGGNQGYQLGCVFAAMATLAAVIERTRSGRGQHADVSLVAAAGVSTEAASYSWLVARETVQRQTGRHAMPYVTTETQAQTADGSWVNTGIAIRGPSAFGAIIDWLSETGVLDDFPDAVLLELGRTGPDITADLIGTDPVATEIVRAGRDALMFLAARLPGYEFFLGAQRHGLQCGAVLTPERVVNDPNMVSRGWPTVIDHPRLQRPITYPGPWFRSTVAPWSIHPAPLPGEHQHEVVAELDAERPPDQRQEMPPR